MAERSASDVSETGFSEDMDPKQLAAWLKGKLPTTLPQAVRDSICTAFETQCICGTVFLMLTKEDLDDMKILIGPRKAILHLISEIKEEQVRQKMTAIDDSVAANTNKGPPLDVVKEKVTAPTNGDLPSSALEKSGQDPSNGADLQDAEFVSKGNNTVSPAAEVNNLPQTKQQDDDAPPQTANGDQPLNVPGETQAAKADTNGGGTGTTTTESKQNDQAAQTDNDNLEFLYSCWSRPSSQKAPLPGEGGAGACGADDVHFWDKESLSVYMNPKEIPKLTHHKWSYKGHLISCQTVVGIAQEWNDTREVPEMQYVPKLKLVDDAGQRDNCDIRVEFSEKESNRTWVGTRAQTERNYNQPTMYLNLSQGNDRHKRHLILHEFGHALGLQHEHQSHNFPSQFIDLEKMKKDLKNKGYKLDDWVIKGQYAVASKYDADSIMHYMIKKEWLKQGYKPGATPNPKLSEDDDAMLKKLHRRIDILPDNISKGDKEWIGKKYKKIRRITTKQDEDTAPPGSSGSGGASQPDATDYEAKREKLIAQFRQGEKTFRKIDQATLNNLVAHRFLDKWEKFGLGVGLTQANLNGIRTQNCHSANFPSSCFSAVFVKWQKTESAPYTWVKVAEVMTEKSFGEMLETRNLLADLTKK